MMTQPAAGADNESHRAYRFLGAELPNCFNLGELKDLCGQLGLDYQRVHHDTLDALADALLRYAANRGRQADLIALLRQERGFVAWPEGYAYPSGGAEEPAPSPSRR